MNAANGTELEWAPSPRGRLKLLLWATLLVVAALLATGQWILNVRTWGTSAGPDPAWLGRLSDALPPASTFPPRANVAFAVFALAGLLFGGLVARRSSPETLFELRPLPPSLTGWRALARPAGLLLVLVLALSEGRVVLQAWRGEDVSPVFFGVATATLLAAAVIVDRGGQVPLPTLRRFLPRLSYSAGVLALLCALAAGHARRPAVLTLSAGLAAVLLGLALRALLREEGADRTALVLMPLLCAGSFLLLSHGLDSWAWAFLGDEYAFYDAASMLLDGGIPLSQLLSGAGAYGYHPVASSVPPVLTMLLFGRDGYGWKVSHSILLALSLLPLHAFARRLLGRTGGLVVAALCGASHTLLSFGKLGSNNAQAVFFLCLCLWAVVSALERGLLTHWVLAGFAVAGGFYTFGIARTFSLVVAFWVAVYAVGRGRSPARMVLAFNTLVGTSILAALPVLSTRNAWQGQTASTVFGLDRPGAEKLALILSNTKHGALSFLVNQHPAVFTFGPLADPITGSLAVLGVFALAFGLARRPRVKLALLGSVFLLVLLLAGIQQYDYPNITRTFALAPVWALLAGVGLMATANMVGMSGRAAAAAAALLVAAVTPLAVFMSVDLSQRKLEQPAIAAILETAERTAAPDGGGPFLHVVVPRAYRYWVDRLYQIFRIPSSRYRVLTPAEALADAPLCRGDGAAVFVVLATENALAEAVASHISVCWPTSPLVAVKDGQGRALVYRALTPAAVPSVHAVPGRLVEEPWTAPKTSREPWSVGQPAGLARDASGNVATVDSSSGEVLILDSEGRVTRSLSAGLVQPVSVAFEPNGGLLVLDTAVGDGIVLFDRDGHVLRRGGYGLGIASPQGLAVAPDGRVFVADTASTRILILDSNFSILREIRPQGLFSQPMAVAVAPDGRIGVSDPAANAAFLLDGEGHLLAKVHLAPGGGLRETPGAVAFEADGAFLVADSMTGQLKRLEKDGSVTVLRGGLSRPAGLVASGDGTLLVLEAGTGRVTRVPPSRAIPPLGSPAPR